MEGNSFIIFISGCAVGGAVSYFVTKHFVEKQERAVSEDKIKSLKAYVEELQAKDQIGDLVDSLSYTPSGNKDEDKAKEDYAWVQNGANKNDVKDPYATFDYTSFYKSGGAGNGSGSAGTDGDIDPAEAEHPTDDEEEEFRQLMKSYEKSKEAEKRIPPKVISSGDYDDPEYDHYDKVTLYYYSENGVLTNEDDEIIDDPEAYIGHSIIATGFDKNQEMALYVRNSSRGTDYEIGKIEGSFGED